MLSDDELLAAFRRAGYHVLPPIDREAALAEVADRPAALLLYLGILERPDLLAMTAIRLADGTQTVIDAQAAGLMARGDAVIPLQLRGGGEREVSRSAIIDAMKAHAPIDQLERRLNRRFANALDE